MASVDVDMSNSMSSFADDEEAGSQASSAVFSESAMNGSDGKGPSGEPESMKDLAKKERNAANRWFYVAAALLFATGVAVVVTACLLFGGDDENSFKQAVSAAALHWQSQTFQSVMTMSLTRSLSFSPS